jgi:hypothetical protein
MEAMTANKTPERKALDRLAEFLVEDILNTSDEDILAEFRESGGDPLLHAAEMRAFLEKSPIAANKHRLAAAQSGVSGSRKARRLSGFPADIAEARRRLRAVLDRPGALSKLTLAARKESELSDADILSMLDDLQELGLLPTENNKGSKKP